MARKKPRDPLTEYRSRKLKEQRLHRRASPASVPAKNNQTLAKVIIIAFVIIILMLVYVLGLFSE